MTPPAITGTAPKAVLSNDRRQRSSSGSRSAAWRRQANDNNTGWLKPAFAGVHRVLKRDALCVSFYGWHIADEFIAAWRAAGS